MPRFPERRRGPGRKPEGAEPHEASEPSAGTESVIAGIGSEDPALTFCKDVVTAVALPSESRVPVVIRERIPGFARKMTHGADRDLPAARSVVRHSRRLRR